MVAQNGSSLSPAPAVRVGRIAAGLARMLLGAVLLAMVLLNVGNAVGRYVFGTVFIGADELLVFGMIWLVMIGMLLVTADRGHIALDFLLNRAGPWTRIALGLFHNVVMLIASAYAAFQSLAFVKHVSTMGQTSMALEIPMLIPHSALIFGFGGTAIVSLLLVISDILAMTSGDDAPGKQVR